MKSLAIFVACCALALPTLLGADTWAGPTYMAGLGLILATLWGAARTAEPRVRPGWTWLAITTALWFAGDVLDRWGTGLGETLYTYAPQACWLGSYLTMSLGILAMIRRRGIATALRREIMLDTLVVAIASTVILWRFLARPSITADMAPMDLLFSLAYPSGDLMLIALWTTLVLAPGRPGLAERLIGLTMAGTVVTDVAFAVLPTIGLDAVAEHLDGVLLILNSLIAVAAAHPSRHLMCAAPVADDHGSSMSGWRVVMLGVALSAVTTSAAIMSGTTGIDLIVTIVAGLAISATILLRFYGLVRDRDAAEQQLVFNAHHDPLTGLANRTLLTSRLRSAVDGCDDLDRVVLFYLDLDGFKPINDRHGHSGGDAVLRELAARMSQVVRPGDTVARIGGDEFVVLCCPLAPAEADAMSRRLIDVIETPVRVAPDADVEVRASIGVAHGGQFPGAVDDALPNLLIDAADHQMYVAKSRARLNAPVAARR